MQTSRVRLLLAVWCAIGAAASANGLAAQVDIVDRTTGQTLPTYQYKGRTYVAGETGHEYEVRVRSQSPRRVLAVTTVDGVNVVTGQTGALDQAGYVLDPYGFTRIEGWRKSLSHTAAFYFTKLPDSYAARTGRPHDVGVIGVALFNERVEPRAYSYRDSEGYRDSEPQSRDSAANSPQAASAPSEYLAEQEVASADKRESAKRAESKLGTGHGRSEHSAAQYTEFERASAKPNEVIAIYYDSRRNLLAQGIIPARPAYAQQLPRAFPDSFVPDP